MGMLVKGTEVMGRYGVKEKECGKTDGGGYCEKEGNGCV